MVHIQLKEDQCFSDIFSTYIIAYCPDTNSWFVTNQRYFYYEYQDKEFNTYEEGVDYFEKNKVIFESIQKMLIGNEDIVYLEKE